MGMVSMQIVSECVGVGLLYGRFECDETEKLLGMGGLVAWLLESFDWSACKMWHCGCNLLDPFTVR
jgi:hypothetical protein